MIGLPSWSRREKIACTWLGSLSNTRTPANSSAASSDGAGVAAGVGVATAAVSGAGVVAGGGVGESASVGTGLGDGAAVGVTSGVAGSAVGSLVGVGMTAVAVGATVGVGCGVSAGTVALTVIGVAGSSSPHAANARHKQPSKTATAQRLIINRYHPARASSPCRLNPMAYNETA